jgi:hypothetical protein
LDAGKEIGLELNPEKTKYMLRAPYQKAGQRHCLNKANSSFEVVVTLKYLGTSLTDQNCLHEEIKTRLNSGNACYHSVQRLLSSRLLSRNVKVDICKTIITPVVLYGCETWSLTLREEHRLRVSKNRVLRRKFGPKREEMTGEWRKLHNEVDQLHNLYSSPDIIRQVQTRRVRWEGHVARMGHERKVYKILVGKPEGKRPLRRPRHRWENWIRMDLREIGLGGC